MNPKTSLKEYSKEIPEEMKDTLYALGNETRLGLLIGLLKIGHMSFNQMKETFNIDSSSLSRHLDYLQRGNLVTNFTEKKHKRIFSYYEVNDLTEKLLTSILEILVRKQDDDNVRAKNKSFIKQLEPNVIQVQESQNIIDDAILFASKVWSSSIYRKAYLETTHQI